MMRTLAGPCQFSEEIRRSRFTAHAGRVQNLEETLALFEAVRQDDANHNCWAFRIGQTYRFSDDGEPGSSAGRPILAAIDGQELDQVMVVVTRWFGGIRLGIGGLVRAYGGVAARCLQQGEILEISASRRLLVQVPYDAVDTLHQLLDSCQASKEDEQWQEGGMRVQLSLPEQAVREFESQLRDATRGQARVRSLLS